MHTSYHFSVGNSDTGHIGLCARVCAKTPEEAVATLREILPPAISTDAGEGAILDLDGLGAEEYVAVYLNPDAFTVSDIDDEEDCNCPGYAGSEI